MEHPPDGGGADGNDVGIEHHKGQAAVTLQGKLRLEVEDGPAPQARSSRIRLLVGGGDVFVGGRDFWYGQVEIETPRNARGFLPSSRN